MPAKARNNKTPMWQTLLAVAFWVAVWQGLAVCIGHNGLFFGHPPANGADLVAAAAHGGFLAQGRVQCAAHFNGLCAGGHRWGCCWGLRGPVAVFGTLVGPVMQLIRAMPVASFVILALLWVSGKNLSVIVSFTHVLPVVYAGTVGGIADTDPALLEMAKVYRLPLGKRLRYIWLPGIFPSFCESCIAAMGMCWKSGVSAEVIGLPDHSVGDALYRAKITISTPEVFAWTLVIVLLSATLSTLAAWALRRAKRALCGEVEG